MGVFALVFYNEFSDGLNDEVWLLPVIAIIFIIFTAFAFDSFFRKASWDDHTLTVKRLYKSTKAIPWGDVTSLKYNSLFQYHYLVFADGTKFAFNEMFLGGQALIMAFEELGQSET